MRVVGCLFVYRYVYVPCGVMLPWPIFLKVARQPRTTRRHGFVWLLHGSGPYRESCCHYMRVPRHAFTGIAIPARHGFVDLCESSGSRQPRSKGLGTGSASGSRVRTGSRLTSADPGGGLRMKPYIYI